MHTVTVSDQSSARRLPALQPIAESLQSYSATADPVLEANAAGTGESRDGTVLLMALEELEFRRAALERLVDENLLCRCLV